MSPYKAPWGPAGFSEVVTAARDLPSDAPRACGDATAPQQWDVALRVPAVLGSCWHWN